MADPYLGEIRLMAFDFPPRGWIQCSGQMLPIAQNQALFALLGTTFGGDGRTTFAVPNMQGRAPLGISDIYRTGTKVGNSQVTLTTAQIPTHTHFMAATNNPSDSDDATGLTLGQSKDASYDPNLNGGLMGSSTFAAAGESAPHSNVQPLLVLSFCIATVGSYPPRP